MMLVLKDQKLANNQCDQIKSCPKCKKSPNLVTLLTIDRDSNKVMGTNF